MARGLAVIAAAGLALAGCGPRVEKREDAAVETGPPGAPARAPFPSCQWVETTGAGLKVWTQSCDYGDRKTKFAFRESEKALVMVEDAGQGFGAGDVISVQRFDLGPDASASELLERLGVPAAASCGLEPAVDYAVDGKQRWHLAPMGAARVAYDAAAASDVQPPPPCGPYGIGPTGDRYFEVHDAHPQTWLFVELGSELQPFDPETIEIVE